MAFLTPSPAGFIMAATSTTDWGAAAARSPNCVAKSALFWAGIAASTSATIVWTVLCLASCAWTETANARRINIAYIFFMILQGLN